MDQLFPNLKWEEVDVISEVDKNFSKQQWIRIGRQTNVFKPGQAKPVPQLTC